MSAPEISKWRNTQSFAPKALMPCQAVTSAMNRIDAIDVPSAFSCPWMSKPVPAAKRSSQPGSITRLAPDCTEMSAITWKGLSTWESVPLSGPARSVA